MSIQKSLVLDHFFFNASAEDFDALKKLQELIPNGIRHSTMKTTDDQWEGIYIRARSGSYLEILRDRRPNSFGIAFQTSDPMLIDASEILNEHPLTWITKTHTLADGQKWFDSISTGKKDLGTLFVAWIMKYYARTSEGRGSPPPRTCDRFDSIHLTVGKAHVDELRGSSEWFPGARTINDNSIAFQVPDRDGWPFDITIDLVDGDQRFEFKKLVIDIYDTSALPEALDQALGSFHLRRDGDSLILTR